jgi:hypothetical protein
MARGITMTPEAQRIAIAEACGWRLYRTPDFDAFYSPCGHYRGGATHNPTQAIENAGVPDYLTDLNAMHEAVMSHNKLLFRDKYKTQLSDVIKRDNPYLSPGKISFLFINATAAQRAEAFLKTLGLWK